MSEQPKDGSDRQDAKAAWSEAGERLSGLGSRLRQHYQQHAQPPAEQTDHPEQTGAQVKDAANRLNQAVHTAFEALASASKDPSVKDDARQAGRSVADALAGTFASISGELGKTFGDKSKSEAPAARPDTAGTRPDPSTPEYGSPEPPSPPTGTPPGVPDPSSPEAGVPEAGVPEAGSPGAGSPAPGSPGAGSPGTPESGRPA